MRGFPFSKPIARTEPPIVLQKHHDQEFQKQVQTTIPAILRIKLFFKALETGHVPEGGYRLGKMRGWIEAVKSLPEVRMAARNRF
jgi:hypothetical protein